MDSLVPSVFSAGLPSAGRKRKGPKRPSAMKYGHAVIKDLLEKLPDNTPRGTVLRGGPDNLPLELKRDNKWVIHFDRKTADGGVHYWPWPQAPNPAIEETLTKKIYDIRTDPPLTALNEVRFSKSRRVLSVGGRKSAKKWVPNEITPETEGEHKGKAYIHGKWSAPGISLGGHYEDYPEWIIENYKSEHPDPKRQRSPVASIIDNPLQLPPLHLPPLVPVAAAPVAAAPVAAPAPAAAPSSPLPTAAAASMPSPSLSMCSLGSAGSLGLGGFETWGSQVAVDDIDMALFGVEVDDACKAAIRRGVQAMTKKQITAAIGRFKLKWDADAKDISAADMKEAYINVLLAPSTVYDSMTSTFRLMAKSSLVYTIPMDTIKTAMNKILRKLGEQLLTI